jgi:hypothetical protein
MASAAGVRAAWPAVTALVLAALSDLGAMPLLVSGSDRPPAVVAASVVVLAVASLAAAGALTRDRRWGRPVGIVSRVIDLAASAPAAVAAGGGLAAAAGATGVLSVVAVVLLIRLGRPAAVSMARNASTSG